MSNGFIKATSVSWFGRIKQSVIGALIGIVLVIGAVVLLFWNEGRAVTTARSLAEGAGVVVPVSSDGVDAANEGRLVHATGTVTTDKTLRDDEFGVEAKGVRLVRKVEMLQWKEETSQETTKNIGGGEDTVTHYSYSTDWSEDPIDSSAFEFPDDRDNPPMEFTSGATLLSDARLGAFELDRSVLGQIDGAQPVKLSAVQKAAVEAAYEGSGKLSLTGDGIYLGENPGKPAVGDYRITYELVPLGDISVVARQHGNGFEGYQTKAGDELLLVESGKVSAEQMFANASGANKILTWILRAVGLIVLLVGFAMILEPLGVAADFIPLLGDIVRTGTGLMAFLLTVIFGTATISIAWFYYRPFVALAVIVAGVAVAMGLIRLSRARKQASAAAVVSTTPACPLGRCADGPLAGRPSAPGGLSPVTTGDAPVGGRRRASRYPPCAP